MTSDLSTTSFKLAKPISKGNRTWKKVNKLAHRLKNKGVPPSIAEVVESVSCISTKTLSGVVFPKNVSLQSMAALAKIQSIEALTLNLNYQMGMEMRKKESNMTDTSERST